MKKLFYGMIAVMMICSSIIPNNFTIAKAYDGVISADFDASQIKQISTTKDLELKTAGMKESVNSWVKNTSKGRQINPSDTYVVGDGAIIKDFLVIDKQTTIIFKGNATVGGQYYNYNIGGVSNFRRPGIDVTGSNKLFIEMEGGSASKVNISVFGCSSAANAAADKTPHTEYGKAAIRLPETAELYVNGMGALNVTGGDGTAAKNGQAGSDAKWEKKPWTELYEKFEGNIWTGTSWTNSIGLTSGHISKFTTTSLKSSGYPALGGVGGTAPGAAIGGNGGKGGRSSWGDQYDVFAQNASDARGKAQSKIFWETNVAKNRKIAPAVTGGWNPWNGIFETDGVPGYPGEKGSDGESAGNVFVFGDITVNAVAGKLPEYKPEQAKTGYAWISNDEKTAVGGSGGAGGGGSASGTAAIGGAGFGGGAGGNSGTGSSMDTSQQMRARGGHGGSGGQGLIGGLGGQGSPAYDGYNGEDGFHATTGAPGAARPPYYANWEGQGGGSTNGAGGPGGRRGTEGGRGGIYMVKDAVVNVTNTSTLKMGSASEVLNSNIISLDNCNVVLKDVPKDADGNYTIAYSGSAFRPIVEITDKITGKVVESKLSTNYDVKYSNNIDVGSGKVILSSYGDLKDKYHLLMGKSGNAADGKQLEIPFKITTIDDPISISIASDTYTYGSSFKANVIDKNPYNNGNITWELDALESTGQAIIEYGVKAPYDEVKIIPTKVGKLVFNVKITPIANSNGLFNFNDTVAVSNKLTIDPFDPTRNLSDIEYTEITTAVYEAGKIKPKFGTGELLKPMVFTRSADASRKTLVEGTDYDMEYNGANLNVGDAGEYKVIWKGNYTGEKTQYFSISARNFNDGITFEAKDIDFDGAPHEQRPLVMIGKNEVPAADYIMTHKRIESTPGFTQKEADCTNVGKIEISLTGKGNLNGAAVTSFYITPHNISENLEVKTAAPDVYFDGTKNESRPILASQGYNIDELVGEVGDHDVANNPSDYKLGFTECVEAGTVTVTVTGVSNFMGTWEYTYKVLPRPLYLLPDKGYWKYYGMDETYILGDEPNVDTMFEHPKYSYYMGKLSADRTKAIDEIEPGFVKGYPVDDSDFEGNMSRDLLGSDEGEKINNGGYDWKVGDLKLSDDSLAENYNHNYQLDVSQLSDRFIVTELDCSYVTIDRSGTLGKHNWFINEPVKVNAPNGYLIGTTNERNSENWKEDYVTYADNDYLKSGVDLYLRQKSTKAISKVKKEFYRQDTTRPTGSIIINDDAYMEVVDDALTKKYELFYNKDAKMKTVAADATSTVVSRMFYLSPKALKRSELDALTVPNDGSLNMIDIVDLTPKNGTISTGKSWNYFENYDLLIDNYDTQKMFIYERIEDWAGNVEYIAPQGVVFDKQLPTLSATYKYDNKWTADRNAEITGNIVDDNAGLKDRYVTYQTVKEIDDGTGGTVEELGNSRLIEPAANGDFKITGLSDGDYKIRISASDKAGNEAMPLTFKIKKDTQEPRVVLSADTITVKDQQPINFAPDIGASGIKKVEVRLDSGAWSEVAEKFDQPFVVSVNGTYSFRITNNAGVVGKEAKISFSRLDNKKPVIEVTAIDSQDQSVAANGYTNDEVTLYFRNATNNLGMSKYEYDLGSGWVVVDNSLALQDSIMLPKIVDEGKYTIKLRVTAANTLVGEKEYVLSIDKTAPGGTVKFEEKSSTKMLNALTLGLAFNKTQLVKLEGFDTISSGISSGIDKIQYYVYAGKGLSVAGAPKSNKEIEFYVNGRWNDQSVTPAAVDPGNIYIVYFKVTDKAGNVSYISSEEVTIDNKAPVITIDYPRADTWDGAIDAHILVDDTSPGVKKVTYDVLDLATSTPIKSAAIGSEDFRINALTNGTYKIIIKAEDLSGNISIKEFSAKQDNGAPTITAAVNAADSNVDAVSIDLEALYSGPAGMDKVLMQVNGRDFVDISGDLSKGSTSIKGKYRVMENGTFVFRAVTAAGVYADASVVVNQFSATAIEARVSAATEVSGKKYIGDTWSNEGVKLSFSNRQANVKGLLHFLRIDGGDFKAVTAVQGYVDVLEKKAGKHEYEYCVVNSINNNESTIKFKVNVDLLAPKAKMETGKKSYDGTDSIGKWPVDEYHKADINVVISGVDQDLASVASGVKSIESYVALKDDLPTSLKGNTVASKVEAIVSGNWVVKDKIVINSLETYVVFGRVSDNAGNISYLSSDGMVFDNISPEIKSNIRTDAISDWYKTDTQNINFEVRDALSGIKDAKFELNGVKKNITDAINTNYGVYSIVSGELKEGKNEIKLDISDKADNVLTQGYIVNKDTVRPTIAVKDLSNPDAGFVTSREIEITHTVGQSGLENIEIREPGSDNWRKNGLSSKFLATKNGVYWFRAVNKIGVASELASLDLNHISEQAPNVNYVVSQQGGGNYVEGQWTTKDIQVEFRDVNDTHKINKFELSIDDGAFEEVPASVTEGGLSYARFNALEGDHVYGMRLQNELGEDSNIAKVTIRIDKTAPVLNVNGDFATWVKEGTEIEVSADDGIGSGLDLAYISFDSGNTWGSETTYVGKSNRNISIQVRDLVGHTTTQEVKVENVDIAGAILTAMNQEKAELETAEEPGVKPVLQKAKAVASENGGVVLGNEAVNVNVDLKDLKDFSKKLGSGIAKAYVSTKFPYVNGVKIDESEMIELEHDVDTDSYMSSKPLQGTYNGDNNIWYYVEDNVGNEAIITGLITDMIGIKGDRPVEEPPVVDPSPSDPGKGDNTVNTDADQKVRSEVTVNDLLVDNNIVDYTDERIAESIAKELKENSNKGINDYVINKNTGTYAEMSTFTKTIPWALLVVAAGVSVLLFMRYKRLNNKKAGEANE